MGQVHRLILIQAKRHYRKDINCLYAPNLGLFYFFINSLLPPPCTANSTRSHFSVKGSYSNQSPTWFLGSASDFRRNSSLLETLQSPSQSDRLLPQFQTQLFPSPSYSLLATMSLLGPLMPAALSLEPALPFCFANSADPIKCFLEMLSNSMLSWFSQKGWIAGLCF